MIPPDRAGELARKVVQLATDFWHLDPNWLVEIKFGEVGEGSGGECNRDIARFYAWLTFDLNHIDEERELWKVAAHEAAHIAVAEFDVYSHVLDRLGANEQRFQDYAWTFSVERIVSRLTRVFLEHHPYPGKGDQHGG